VQEQTFVWVFVSKEGSPGAVFSNTEIAEAWIAKWALSGLLTKYPLDVGAFDWAVERGFFRPKKAEHTSSTFVGSFTTASMEHHHYEGGCRLA